MKKVFTILLVFASSFCMAQVFVNKVDINTFDYQYIEVWEHYNKRNGKFYAKIDYGQDNQTLEESEHLKMTNATGVVMEFNSVVSILNYLYRNGWKVLETKDTKGYTSYLMERRKSMN